MIVRTYENIETGERHEEFLSIADHEQYEKDHPEFKYVIGSLNVVDPIGIGVKRPPTEFLKNVVGRVKGNHPEGGALEKRWNIPREW